MPAEVESGFYNVERGVPWHKQGTAFPGFLTAAEVLEAAGLDWTVSLRNIYADATDGGQVFIPNQSAVVRDTDDHPYGIVGRLYEPAQNADVLSFLDGMIGLGEAVYDSAWSLHEGRTTAISTMLPSITPVEGEEIRMYLTAANTHGGFGAIKFIVSPVRVVCMNTLAMAISGAKYTWSRKHTSTALNEESMAAAREALGIAGVYAARIDEVAKDLLGQVFTPQMMGRLAKKLAFDGETDPSKAQLLMAADMVDLWKHSPNLENVRKTKWGALNAVAEFADYHTRYVGKSAQDNRTESILYGNAAIMKTVALDWLTAAA